MLDELVINFSACEENTMSTSGKFLIAKEEIINYSDKKRKRKVESQIKRIKKLLFMLKENSCIGWIELKIAGMVWLACFDGQLIANIQRKKQVMESIEEIKKLACLIAENPLVIANVDLMLRFGHSE